MLDKIKSAKRGVKTSRLAQKIEGNMEVNKKIKELRLLNNLTQIQLAEQTGITRSTIAQYETRNVEPTASNIIKLAYFFDVSTDYLLGIELEDGTKARRELVLNDIAHKHQKV